MTTAPRPEWTYWGFRGLDPMTGIYVSGFAVIAMRRGVISVCPIGPEASRDWECIARAASLARSEAEIKTAPADG